MSLTLKEELLSSINFRIYDYRLKQKDSILNVLGESFVTTENHKKLKSKIIEWEREIIELEKQKVRLEYSFQ